MIKWTESRKDNWDPLLFLATLDSEAKLDSFCKAGFHPGLSSWGKKHGEEGGAMIPWEGCSSLLMTVCTMASQHKSHCVARTFQIS